MGKDEIEFLREIAKKADESGVQVENLEVTGRKVPIESRPEPHGDQAYRQAQAKILEEKMAEVDRIAKAKQTHEEIKNIIDKLDKAA